LNGMKQHPRPGNFCMSMLQNAMSGYNSLVAMDL
jgi:hypothetical protein